MFRRRSFVDQQVANGAFILRDEYGKGWASDQTPDGDQSTHSLFTASDKSTQETHGPESQPTTFSQHQGISSPWDTASQTWADGTAPLVGPLHFQYPSVSHGNPAGYIALDTRQTGTWMSEASPSRDMDNFEEDGETEALSTEDGEGTSPHSAQSHAPAEPDRPRVPTSEQTHPQGRYRPLRSAADRNAEKPPVVPIPTTLAARESHAPPGPGMEQCDKCSKWVKKRNGGLRKHFKRAHIKEKPHTCDYCIMRQFYDHRDLARHIESAHIKEKWYPCPTCGREFNRRDNLNRHMKQQHPT